MALPNFLVIGAQKSETTWLHRFFETRPDVCVPATTKELRLFGDERRWNTLGMSWYEEQFEPNAETRAIGEVTPGYLWVSSERAEWGVPSAFRRGTPERIREHLGADVRLVVTLRNPVARAMSGYMHHVRMGRIKPGTPLNEEWKRGRLGIVHMGFYAAHLAAWRKVYPRDNFFVTTYEQLFSDPGVVRQILAFIGAEPVVPGEMLQQSVHRGLRHAHDHRGATDDAGRRIVAAAGIAKLRDVYRDDVARLRDEWGVDTSVWDDFN